MQVYLHEGEVATTSTWDKMTQTFLHSEEKLVTFFQYCFFADLFTSICFQYICQIQNVNGHLVVTEMYPLLLKIDLYKDRCYWKCFLWG